jgi:hypothetical protein
MRITILNLMMYQVKQMIVLQYQKMKIIKASKIKMIINLQVILMNKLYKIKHKKTIYKIKT